MEGKFYDKVDDALLKFAVIIAKSQGKWVFCKHKERNTYEVPGGRREPNESILETAKRELSEETGAESKKTIFRTGCKNCNYTGYVSCFK